MDKPALNRRQLLKGVSASLGVLALRGFEVHAVSHFISPTGLPLETRYPIG